MLLDLSSHLDQAEEKKRKKMSGRSIYTMIKSIENNDVVIDTMFGLSS